MTYIVNYSKAHEAAQEIGQYDDFAAAEAAARKAGAVGEGQKSGKDFIYDVDGHDDYGIWIEISR